MKHLNVPMEIKALDDSGTFAGYASVFGNIDLGGDIVERGAFKELVTNEMGQVTVLWQHNTRDPIGVAAVKQDDKGLAFEGRLVLEDATARKAYAHLKAKSVRGMSIGFDVLEGGAKVLESGVRLLKALKLWEISVVTFGMNQAAQVEAVKQVMQITTVREFEDFLRDVGNFSNAKAKAIASGGWPAIVKPRDDGDEVAIAKAVRDFCAGLKAL